jgi:hypothetical protein
MDGRSRDGMSNKPLHVPQLLFGIAIDLVPKMPFSMRRCYDAENYGCPSFLLSDCLLQYMVKEASPVAAGM